MPGDTLLVFAHGDEAAAFVSAGVPHLLTGVGKVNAALELTRGVLDGSPPDRVVVLGTAGAVSDDARLDTVYQISAGVQHDFSLPSPRLELADPIIDETAVIATGDVFVQDDAQRAVLAALGATLVDMETYAYASVCARLGIPLQVFKTPSDFADSSTTQDEWDGIAGAKSRQLFAFVEERLPELLG
ncbi:purine-nucleoside phosphorylase [Leucobacter weissii]|uniref:phosphorylase family protein n=1 Tax=Leucobacter weissii TaxID=1983706 RepID=UPI0031331B05